MSEQTPTSNLLIDEAPLQFLPSLAVALGGSNEALLMQQLHFLCVITEKAKNKGHFFDGKWWVYSSYEEWHQKEFPWIAASTIKRILLKFEADGLVFSRDKVDGRSKVGKWYSINYQALSALAITPRPKKQKTRNKAQHDTRSYQNDHSTQTKMIRPPYQNEPSYYTETNTETINRNITTAADTTPPAATPKPNTQQQTPVKAPVVTESKTSTRTPDPLFDAIAEAWRTGAGLVAKLKKQMLGGYSPTDRLYACNFDRPVTPDEVRDFVAWYRNKYRDLDLPVTPEKVQHHFYQFRATTTHNPPQPLNTRTVNGVVQERVGGVWYTKRNPPTGAA